MAASQRPETCLIEQCRIRRATQGDFAALWKLECVAHSHPWAEDVLRAFLEANGVKLWLVETSDNRIIAFAALQFVIDEASLLNLVVDPAQQHQGIGRYLLTSLIDLMINEGVVKSIFLEVRVSNYPAIALYHSCGFVEIAQRAEYYPLNEGKREDALMMALPLQISFE